MLTAFTRLLMLLTIVTLTPAITRADPIIITSGSLSVTGLSGSPVYSLMGTNFAATGSGFDSGATGPAISCFPCVTGDVINPNSNFVDSTLGRGSVTINGSTFNQIFISGALTFTGPGIVVPEGGLNLTLTTPFVLSGFMAGCLEDHLFCRTVVFSTQVTGAGLASIRLQGFIDSQNRTQYTFRSVTYSFDSTTIPEPTSILFLASGLAALGAARVRLRAAIRRRRQPPL